MQGEPANTGTLELFRLIILMFIIALFISSTGSEGNNLRSEKPNREVVERTAIEKNLVLDLENMLKLPSRYSYNISGLFAGNWKRNNSTNIADVNPSVHLGVQVPNVQVNSSREPSLKGNEGTFMLNILEYRTRRDLIHALTASMVLIQGEQDVEEDSLKLSMDGYYFVPAGYASVSEGTRWMKKYIHWSSPDMVSNNTQRAAVTNEFKDTIGYSLGGENVLHLPHDMAVNFSPKLLHCVYQLDLQMSPLPVDQPADVALNPHSRMKINMTGTLESPNCGLSLTIAASGSVIDIANAVSKSRWLAAFCSLMTLVEGIFYLNQLKRYVTQSSSGASILTMILLSLQTLIMTVGFLVFNVMFNGIFSDFFNVSFHKMILFTLLEIRIIVVIWNTQQQVQQQEPNADGESLDRIRFRKLNWIFFSMYALMVISLFIIFSQSVFAYYVVFVLFSFWVPQILHSLKSGIRAPISGRMIVLMTLSQLFLPVYVFVYPDNLLKILYENEVSRSFGYLLILWIIFQGVVVYCQTSFNPYIILPQFLRPKMYNYHAIPNTDQVQNNECAICMTDVDYTSNKEYMITPCGHVFHAHCLNQWLDVKMECPTCRAHLPDVRFL